MTFKLKDIIDLDYLVNLDDALDSETDIRLREERDKKIHGLCRETCQTDEALLMAWLQAMRQEFYEKKKTPLLPGAVFLSLYSFMTYLMIFSGGLSGLSLAWSFLAYHGTRPVNVAVFISLFIFLQVALTLITIFFLFQRHFKIKLKKNRLQNSVLHTLLSSFLFQLLPGLLKKIEWPLFKKGLDTLEYTSVLIRMKNREYKTLFFWPIFILTSVFAFCFATGALGGTFFRVIVSDMAFGWQSTLMTTSERIHDLLTWIALPWSWFMPENLAHPTLSQIEGSRIILKEGISVLATRDLVSWWPFLCLGILFYTVLPRGLLMATGIIAQYTVLRGFSLNRPVFRPLLIRMQSSILDVDTGDPCLERTAAEGPALPGEPFLKPSIPGAASRKALVLAPQGVYSDEAGQKINHHIRTRLFFDVKEMIKVALDPKKDADILSRIKNHGADQVVLVHEAWQPPIRGLLYYIRELKSVMPKEMMLWILLTREAGQKTLCMDETDINFEIWKKSVFNLGDPGIKVMGLL